MPLFRVSSQSTNIQQHSLRAANVYFIQCKIIFKSFVFNHRFVPHFTCVIITRCVTSIIIIMPSEPNSEPEPKSGVRAKILSQRSVHAARGWIHRICCSALLIMNPSSVQTVLVSGLWSSLEHVLEVNSKLAPDLEALRNLGVLWFDWTPPHTNDHRQS